MRNFFQFQQKTNTQPESGIGRKNTRWKLNVMDPEEDLKNVLAGWNARNEKVVQNVDSIETLPALPIAGKHDIARTAIDILLETNENCLEERIESAVVDPAALSQIATALADSNNSTEIAKIHTKLMRANPGNPQAAERQFDTVLQFLVLKNRQIFAQTCLAQITAADSPSQIQQKIDTQNKVFSEETRQLKDHINQALQPTHRIKGNAMENMAQYTNQAFRAAAKYESEFQSQKQNLIEHIDVTAAIMQHMKPENELQRLDAQREAADEKLDRISEKFAENTPEKTALIYAMDLEILRARANRSSTEENIQALNDEHKNTPPNFHTEKIQDAIAPKLREAQPVLQRIIEIETQKEQAIETDAAFKAAEREAKLEELQKTLDEKEEGFITTIDNGEIINLAKEIGQLQAEEQLAPLGIKDKPAYKIAQARSQYQNTLLSLRTAINENNNPHPDVLANIQLTIDATRAEYKKTVMELHKKAGTDKTLSNLSAPLDALRDNPRGSLMATIRDNSPSTIQKTAPRFGYKQGPAHLPELNMNKYDLTGAELPGVLNRIDIETKNVNALLGKREQLERAIEANPELAKNPTYLKEISENTRELEERMTELTKKINEAHKAGFMEAHPDIEEYGRQVSRLQDAVNRKAFRERHHLINNATQLANGYGWLNPINRLAGLATGGAKQNIQGIPNMQYNANAAKELETTVSTKYYEQLGMFKWRIRDHKTKIKHPDGNEVTEDIKFSKQEFKEHFTDFCAQQDLENTSRFFSKLGNYTGVKVKENQNQITYTWPNPDIKQAWLDYLKEKYIAKRAEELKTPQPEAQVDVQNNDAANNNAIQGAPPAPPAPQQQQQQWQQQQQQDLSNDNNGYQSPSPFQH